ncbi:MAG: ATP synthase subunit I, partial [Desulfobacterales bacterium]
MDIQQRIIRFVTRSNWILFAVTSIAGFVIFSRSVALGIVFGGLIVTINFHLLAKTLKKALTP